ncbi:MAG: efflux RND transporter periplasmic adaptor subunit [Chloroflexota bacterium]
MTTVPVMGQQAEESPVQDTFTVEPDTLMVTVSATGIVEPVRAVSLVFEASAPVTAINFQEGDTVEAGDILATLDADDLEAALREAEIALELQQLSFEALIAPPREVDIAAAEAAVAAAEAGVPAAGQGSTREQIEIARLNAELARNQLWQSQLQRDQIFDTRPEFRPGATTVFGSQSGVESAEFGVGIADANVQATIQAGGGLGAIASAEAALVRSQVALDELLRGPDQVDILRFEIQLDQSELAVEQARVALERAQLEAPFGGVVSQNNLSLGELPPATQPAIELIDNSSYFIDLAIDETDVVNVQLGQEVSLRLDALGETQLTGAITRLSVLPDANNTVVVYRARVTLDPTEAPIRVGMSTTATITTSELEDVLVVPNRFIRPDPDDANAFFVTIQSGENQFQEIPVQVGERNNEVTQILSGVEPGQVIVQVRRDAPGVEVLFGN